MTTTIALLRGINVGGRHKLPMQALRSLFEDLGLDNVRTYIQSGNVVFESGEADKARLVEQIEAAIAADYGFKPAILLLTVDQLAAAMAANPFPEGQEEPKSLHLYFAAAPPPDPDLAALQEVKQEDERFALIDAVFYLHAPSGIGRSKLASIVEKALGVPVTARNWRSVSKIMAMAQ